MGAVDSGNVPGDAGIPGDTGASIVGGRVYELDGFGFGTCGGGRRGGICAAARLTKARLATTRLAITRLETRFATGRADSATQQERTVFMIAPKTIRTVPIR